MKLHWTRGIRRTLTVVSTAIAAVLALALPASAHDAIFLDESDILPWQAPLSLNADDPLSFYGTLPHAGAVRTYQFDSYGTMPLSIATLIPGGTAAEAQLDTWALPRIVLVDPELKTTVIEPTIREEQPIPELNQYYLRINKYEAPSKVGRYTVIITGLAPARFNISTGHHGVTFHGLERGEVASPERIIEWYNTPA